MKQNMWRSQRGSGAQRCSLNPGSFIFYGIPTTGSSFTSIPQVSPLSNGLRGVTSAFCATFADAESVNSTSHQPESQNVAVLFTCFLLRQCHCKPGDSHVFVIHWPATIRAPVLCVKSQFKACWRAGWLVHKGSSWFLSRLTVHRRLN